MNSYSSYPLNFPTDILFSFLVSFAFCVLVIFVFFLLFFKKIKIYILIYASDKKNSPVRFPETRLLFFGQKTSIFQCQNQSQKGQNITYHLDLSFLTPLPIKI